MPGSRAITDRTDPINRWARAAAVLLTAVGAVCFTAAWHVQHDTNTHRAAVRTAVPSVLDVPPTASTTRPAAIARAVVPAHLFVPALGVNTTVGAKPTQHDRDPFVGATVASFGVPDDMYTTTWWSSGPRPGAPGMAVILGHTQIGGYGVFNHLARLRPGQTVGVTGGATTLRFAVESVRTGIRKTDPTALRSVLADHPRDARLALLTCSGRFDGGYRQSSENTVVFARLLSGG